MTIPEENELFFNKNILNVGYGSTYTCINFGTSFLLYIYFTSSALVLALMKPLANRNKFLLKWHSKFAKPLYWNIFLRLTIEFTLEISVSAINNIQMEFAMYQANQSTFYQKSLPFFWINLFTNILSVLYLVFGIPLILYFFLSRFNQWNVGSFQDKFGAPLDSLRTDIKHSMFYPAFFIFRRVIYAWQGVCLTGNYLTTMHTQFYLTIVQIAFILICSPFESQLLTVLELMNEVTFLLCLYSVFMFNHLYVTDQYFIDDVGYFMMSVIGLCIAVHFFFLAKTMLQDFQSKIKQCRLRLKKKTRARNASQTKISVEVEVNRNK